MKKILFFATTLAMLAAMSSCKSSHESAYRRAYNNAKAQESAIVNQTEGTTVVTVDESDVVETPVTTQPVTVQRVEANPAAQDMTGVRTINGNVEVVNGDALKAFSVVVGSFQNQANAEGACNELRAAGYSARVIRTNETINGFTGWYRVIASSFDSKASAVQSRDELIGKYKGAWVLYRK